MPTPQEIAMLAFGAFQMNPAYTLRGCSFQISQVGHSTRGGLCTVAGGDHKSELEGKSTAQYGVKSEYQRNTAIHSLHVTPGAGDGSVYWYPYIDRGVGTCEIRYAAAQGTVALTAGMNGCSLRIYANPRLGIVRFAHDNNGSYVDDDLYRSQGFQHVQSINAKARPDRMRGHATQNINNYWTGDLETSSLLNGIFFLAYKSGATQWQIYKSIVIANQVGQIKYTGIFTTNTQNRVDTYTWKDAQRHNTLVATVNLPPIVPRRNHTTSLTDDDLETTGTGGGTRPRSFSQ